MATKPEAGGGDLNFIGAGTVVEGKIRTPGSLRIDGKIVGEVVVNQSVSIGATADIEGTLTAKNITIGGLVKGNVIAQEKLVFENKAVVRGEIKAAKLVIDEGALFDGKCSMGEAKAAPGIVEPKQPDRRAEER